MSWLQRLRDGVALQYSQLGDGGWSPQTTIATGTDWFVNWADFPSVVPITDELWAAHWLVHSQSRGYAYDVAIALSQDGGESWRDAIKPHTDGTATEHGFVSLYPMETGVGALWLDGRNTLSGASMTLRAAVVQDDGTVVDERVVDERVCDCCQTDAALIGKDPIVVFRDRSDKEIRDISITRQVDGIWQSPQPVAADGWQIDGCPVNGPAIAVNGRSVAVAWYTQASNVSRVKLARSVDAGETFAEPIEIDALDPMGRVDVVQLDDGSTVVSWMRGGADRLAQVMVRRVAADGMLGRVSRIAQTRASRPSGFPQMVESRAKLIFAWTDTSEAAGQVRTAQLSAADL